MCACVSYSQEALIIGNVENLYTREPIVNAIVSIQNSEQYTTTDSVGNWQISVEPGIYNIQYSHLNYIKQVEYEIEVLKSRPTILAAKLKDKLNVINEVTIQVKKTNFQNQRTQSIVKLGLDEIQRMPGATMDISKTLKSLPGVIPKVSFGYNFIVRGGGSFENGYYLDEIRIPSITHFNVQGLSGGPNGLINTDLVKEIIFNTGAYEADISNALSSTLKISPRYGRKDRLGGKFTLGASEYGLHLEGPMTSKSSYILSFRKSYTEYLLKAFNVPVIPSFIDYQYHHKIELSKNDHLKIIALGTNDKYNINRDGELTEALQYNIGYIPDGNQQVNVFGAIYKHYKKNSIYQLVLSHDRLVNAASKHKNNTSSSDDLLLKYLSEEDNTRFQLKNKIFRNDLILTYGIDYTLSSLELDQYSVIARQNLSVDTSNFKVKIPYQQYGVFLYLSNRLANKLEYKIGARIDGNTAGDKMINPFKQISPRISLDYKINEKITTSIQTGLYYQLPPNVLLGYPTRFNSFNKDVLQYIQLFQTSAGAHIELNNNRNISLEGFYKKYNQYPFLTRDSISFANANGEYVVVGNQPANSTSRGRAYGVEMFFRQQLFKSYYGNLALSYVRSEFLDKNNKYISSSWDSRYYVNIVFGKKLKKNWTLGIKWTYSGSNPYTPFDKKTSSLIDFWDANQRGILDYSLLNSERLPAYHALDFRIDKKWYLERITIRLFMDIQNLYNNKFKLLPYLTVERDENNKPIVDNSTFASYKTKIIKSDTGRVLPTIGFSIQF